MKQSSNRVLTGKPVQRSTSSSSSSFTSSLWSDLDTGTGQWENVPLVLRSAFRALLDHTDEASLKSKAHIDSVAEQAEKQNEILQASKTALALDIKRLDQRIDAVDKIEQHRQKREKEYEKLPDRAEKAEARVEKIAKDFYEFRMEAQKAIIASVKAANEARTVASQALSKFELALAEPPATAEALAAAMSEIKTLRSELSTLRADVSKKADLAEISESLEDKVGRSVVVAALQKKLSVAKLPDALSPITTRVEQAEKAVKMADEKALSARGASDEIERKMFSVSSRLHAVEQQQQLLLEEAHMRVSAATAPKPQPAQAPPSFSEMAQINLVNNRIQALENAVAGNLSTISGLSAGFNSLQDRLLDAHSSVGLARSTATTETIRVREELSASIAALRADVNNRFASIGLGATTNSHTNSEKQQEGSLKLTSEAVLQHIKSELSTWKAEQEDVIARALSSGNSNHSTAAMETRNRQSLSGQSSSSSNSSSTYVDASSSTGVSGSSSRFKTELESTRNDLKTLAGEVQGIIDLLDIGSIEVIEGKGRATDESNSSSSIKFSAATLSGALRKSVAHLTERLTHLEQQFGDIRGSIDRTRGTVGEYQEVLVDHANSMDALRAESDLLVMRVQALEDLSSTGTNGVIQRVAAAKDVQEQVGFQSHFSKSPQSFASSQAHTSRGPLRATFASTTGVHATVNGQKPQFLSPVTQRQQQSTSQRLSSRREAVEVYGSSWPREVQGPARPQSPDVRRNLIVTSPLFTR